MTWDEKIIKGMQLIQEGCEETGDYEDCSDCPFKEICEASDSTPAGWLV